MSQLPLNGSAKQVPQASAFTRALFKPAPEPKSLLGYHRVLSPTASVKVSPLCLGAMNFGDAWSDLMGECTKETAFEMMDFFKSHGGNFIDTASVYQSEQSEQWIGEWMASRKCRDEIVLATKYTGGWKTHEGHDAKIQSNFGGNNAKSLHLSVRDSLRKLQTDYIDVLYVHFPDHHTSIPEMMHSLNDQVTRGNVLYLATSDMPAWVVSKANEYARGHNLRQFVVYQGYWSAAKRDFEREIIPMCRDEGMALAPFGVLGRGNFKTKEQRESTEGRKMRAASDTDIRVSEVLEKVAKRKNTLLTSVALAYVMQKTPYVFPIVGGRNVKQLQGNIDALAVELTSDDVKEIEDAVPFEKGFPYDHVGQTPEDSFPMTLMGHFDFVEKERPIPLGKHKAN